MISPFSEDVPTYLVNALAPVEVTSSLDEDDKEVEIIVPDEQLSLVYERQNVRLACQLTGKFNILTEGSRI